VRVSLCQGARRLEGSLPAFCLQDGNAIVVAAYGNIMRVRTVVLAPASELTLGQGLLVPCKYMCMRMRTQQERHLAKRRRQTLGARTHTTQTCAVNIVHPYSAIATPKGSDDFAARAFELTTHHLCALAPEPVVAHLRTKSHRDTEKGRGGEGRVWTQRDGRYRAA
jgi:hypothetical protein